MENTEFHRDLNVCDNAKMILVPEGTFLMGSDRKEVLALWHKMGWDQRWFNAQVGADHWIGELHIHEVEISSFWIYEELVTIGQYYTFMKDTQREAPVDPRVHGPWNSAWKDGIPIPGSEQLPVSSVSWESDGEHILQNFLGTRWTSLEIVYNEVQAEFGQTIDASLERGLQPIRNLRGYKSDEGADRPGCS